MSSKLTKLASVEVHISCPDCGSRQMKRTSDTRDRVTSMNGSTLFHMTERCMMCGYTMETSNVKVGI